jgi:hypothetical protein
MSRASAVFSLLLVFVAGPAAAGKFDLSPYYGPPPIAGDFRVFELSTGGARTLEVVEVSLWKKGFRYLNEVTETGQEPALVETFLIPGKKELMGDAFSGGLFIDLKKPKTLYNLRVKPGKTNKISAKGSAFFDGAWLGMATYKGGWAFMGLEPLDTPAASYPDTAVLNMVLILTVKDRLFGNVIEAIVEQVIWSARDLGEVASRERTTAWLNGVLQDDSGWIEAWLVDGMLGGQPTP